MEEKIFEFKDENGKIYYYSSYNEYPRIEKVIKNGKIKFRANTPCWKCGGHKIIPQFGHIFEGTCFACGGSGYQMCNIKAARNKETIERRLKAKRDKEQAIKDNFANNNLKKTLELYSEKFYIILDTPGHSTYDEKEFLKKEKEAHWNSWFRKWWSKRNDIENFNLIEIDTMKVLTSTNTLDISLIETIIYNYLDNKKKVKN